MNISYNTLIEIKLLTFLRVPWFRATLRAMVVAISTAKANADAVKTAADYELRATGQTTRLQAVLNDAVDKSKRRVVVSDFEAEDYFYLWAGNETTDSDIDASTLLVSTQFVESSMLNADFVVWLPAEVYDNNALKQRATAIVSRYKLPGRRFAVLNIQA
jgi:hypothetical protein